MTDAMVTGRMPAKKKEAGNKVLAKAGLNASQAINLLYDRLVAERDVSFLIPTATESNEETWRAAADFIDALSIPRASRFDTMSKAEIKAERLAARGLM